MSERAPDQPTDELGEILDALENSGLAEVYTDEDGREVMRLTDEGASMAQELGILGHGDGSPEGAPVPESAPSALDTRNTFGTAMGAAMLGFEQALRTEPPPDTVAADHIPERGTSGSDEGIVIEFPDEVKRPER